jgi:hypothetical protein
MQIFEGSNPKSAAGVKQNRQGFEGASRHEGNQTLKVEQSEWANSRKVDLEDLMC